MRELNFLNNPNDAIRVRDNDFETLQIQDHAIQQAMGDYTDSQYTGIHSTGKVLTPIAFQLLSENEVEISQEDTILMINNKIHTYESNVFEVLNPTSPDQQYDSRGRRWFAFVPNPNITNTPRPTLLGGSFNRVTYRTCQIKRLQDCTPSELFLCVPFWINSNASTVFEYDYPKPFIPFFKHYTGSWQSQSGFEIEVAKIRNQVFIRGNLKIGDLIPNNTTQPFIPTNVPKLPQMYRPKREVVVNTKSSYDGGFNWRYYADVDTAVGFTEFGQLKVRTSDWNALNQSQDFDTQFEISYFV